MDQVAEILKDRPSWLPDCRCLDILGAFPTGNGGTVELIYTQMYAPTTLAPPRDFCTLRYTTLLEDGSLVVCWWKSFSMHTRCPWLLASVSSQFISGRGNCWMSRLALREFKDAMLNSKI
jgi:hypothetical protein